MKIIFVIMMLICISIKNDYAILTYLIDNYFDNATMLPKCCCSELSNVKYLKKY